MLKKILLSFATFLILFIIHSSGFIIQSYGQTPIPTLPVGPNTFLETFNGIPATPQPFTSPNWDIAVHSREVDSWDSLFPMEAQHGPDCSPPPATHSMSSYEDAVFNCKNHIMTSINPAGGYAVIYLTPNRMVDFSQGEAVIKFDMSTARNSYGDWIDIWVTPFEDNMQLPLLDFQPDLQGNPRQGIELMMDYQHTTNPDNGPEQTTFKGLVFRNYNASSLNVNSNLRYENFLPAPGFSATRRDTFEVRISRTRIKFCMPVDPVDNAPAQTQCWLDQTIADLGWDKGIVQLGHHSNDPTKFPWTNPDGVSIIGPNTWHWDNVSISPSIPFTIIKGDKRTIVGSDSNTTVTFTNPAPTNAFLRFSGIGTIQVSFDNGTTWQAAIRQDGSEETSGGGGHQVNEYSSYWHPIPIGKESVRFKFAGESWYNYGPGYYRAKDFAIWSEAAPLATPTMILDTPTPTSSTTTPTPKKLGDVDGNGVVDIYDFNELIAHFGETGANIPADLDKSGEVGIEDFNEVVANFSP